MADYVAYFNGDWVSFEDVKVSPHDRGFTVADVVFDVARTFNGKSFRMKQHVDRLYRSLKFVRIDPGLSPDEMLSVSEESIERNMDLLPDAGDFTVRQWVTRGPGRWAHTAGPPTVCVEVQRISFERYAGLYADGAHGVIARTRSYPAESLDPKVKHYSRMNFNLAELEAADVDESAWPILLDGDGNLTEGTGYNVFLVTDGVLRLPGDSTLLQGSLARHGGRPGPAARHPHRRRGAAALRPLHRRRGVLLRHQPLRAARHAGRPAGGRRRRARAGHPAASRGVERDRGAGHSGPGDALQQRMTRPLRGCLQRPFPL